ncbi:MAG: hypothetical protein K0R07_1996 [Sedimentibacter sp.]|nr:hypothetical protein [Sedimentibacter sp.]
MKRLSAIVLITIASVYILAGCTMMPASQETGVGPDEYAEIKSTEAINKENEDLKKELESKKTEISKMEKDYLELAKNNETMLSKLEEAETKLNILGNEGIPKFNSEKNDKNSIVAYLNNNKTELEKRLKGIEIVDSTDESKVLFYTTGYGEVLNQLFIWNQGENEPILIDGADFEKGGLLSWIDNKFLEIKSGGNEYKILNVGSKNIISKFSSKQDAYLIPETSSYIMQKKDNGTFVIYDFINSKEQDITLDNKGKFTAFEINGGNIIFKGVYTDENETQYSVEASMSIDKLKEKYNILTLNEVIEIKENNGNSTNNETTNEGTV